MELPSAHLEIMITFKSNLGVTRLSGLLGHPTQQYVSGFNTVSCTVHVVVISIGIKYLGIGNLSCFTTLKILPCFTTI